MAAVGTHAWDTRPRPAASPGVDVHISLVAHGGELDEVKQGRAVVALTVVLINALSTRRRPAFLTSTASGG